MVQDPGQVAAEVHPLRVGPGWRPLGDGGGEDIDSYDYPNTTEIFDGSEFRPFIEMPVSTRDHCVTRLAGSEVLVMGGE